ncbi:MAG: hypothetical protein AB7O67_06280 [Vicinamibacterales bacterium]
MLPVLVTCLESPAYRDWGLAPERIPAPVLAIEGPAGPPAEVLARAFEAFPDATRACLARAAFLYEHFNFGYLYEGALHRWLAERPEDPFAFRRVVMPWPADLLMVSRDTRAAADLDMPCSAAGEIELELLAYDPRPKTLVFGDSHVWNLFTRVDLIGSRGVVIEPMDVPGGHLKISRHMGPLTMHRLAGDADLTASFFRGYGIRPGDRVVAVCGEIDVRNHVVRIAEREGRPTADVVSDLCGRFCDRLAAVVAECGPLDVVVACPTPQIDYQQLGRADVEHAGTVAQRVSCTQVMRRCLAAACATRGWTLLDVHDEFATADGTLDLDRSDRFCHVAHGEKGPALDALHRIIEAGGRAGTARGA